MEVPVATLPVLFLFVIARGTTATPRSRSPGRCSGSSGSAWPFAHAVLLRQLPHGNGVLIDVLLGTFIGDTAAYIGGRLFGRRPLARRSPRTRPSRACSAGC